MTDSIASVLDRKGRSIVTTPSHVTVSTAVAQMNRCHIGSLVVIDDGRLVGIFTERDVLARVIATGLEPRTTVVTHVMTHDPITIRPDTTIGEALAIMTEKRCRHLPVVDDGGLCGLISAGDLTSWVVHVHERTIHDLHDYIRAA